MTGSGESEGSDQRGVRELQGSGSPRRGTLVRANRAIWIVLVAVLIVGGLLVAGYRMAAQRRAAVLRDAAAYIQAWIHEDYGRMYTLLSASTRAQISREEFIQRSRYAAHELVHPRELIRIEVAALHGNRALVCYMLRSTVTARQAAYLARLGEPVLGSERTHRTCRWFVFEDGRWRMMVNRRRLSAQEPRP